MLMSLDKPLQIMTLTILKPQFVNYQGYSQVEVLECSLLLRTYIYDVSIALRCSVGTVRSNNIAKEKLSQPSILHVTDHCRDRTAGSCWQLRKGNRV